MTKFLLYALKQSAALGVFMVFFLNIVWAQTPLPFTIKNTSPYKDEELYVTIVGENFSGSHVWVDCKTGVQNLMSPSYNTVSGPVYGGNRGPGLNGMYANCFTKLSDIPNKTIMLSPIQGCRAFIAVKQQLYFYFFGASGARSGYTSPSHTDPTDPNKGIKYEIIELTYNQYGFWGNTTRVDSYNYPMGLELTSTNGTVMKTGELKSHEEIGAAFKASVPAEFQNCYDPATGAIVFPTKTAAFADGTIGGMPVGPYVNYMKPYIDAIWAKYANEDLIFDAGDAGTWKGRVQNEQLIMTCISGGFTGRKGIIQKRPSTQEAFEGKGVLDRVIQDGTTDLVVQAQFCAALTRHLVDVKAPNVGLQKWSDPSKYYLESPCNYYAKFWHQPGISLNEKSYGFAYDDVFDQSATLHSPSPSKMLILFGGFAGESSNKPPVVTITSPSVNATFSVPATVDIAVSATDTDGTIAKVEFYNGGTKLGEDFTSPYNFTWAGVGVGVYSIIAKAIDNGGAVATSSTVLINVNNPVLVQSPYGGTRWAIPGIIESENYDIGGQNVAFNETSAGNQGGAFRSDPVDIEAIPGGGFNVGYIQQGEWLEYSVNVNTSGNYRLVARVAATTPGKTFNVEMDGTLIGTFTVPNTGGWQTWETITLNNIPLTAGPKVMRVVATSSEFNIDKLVFSAIVANQFPVASIVSPINEATFIAPGVINITASATDADGSIIKVDFFQGATLIGSDRSAPYSFLWNNVTAGKYNLTVRATDNSGAITTSSIVVVNVTLPNVNKAPLVNITSPVGGAIFTSPASISIDANASDSDGQVAKVEFYNGSVLIGSDITSPYNFVWNNVAAGTYVITARATDNKGAVSNSSNVTLVVNSIVGDYCSSLSEYKENNGYVPGSKVKNAGSRFECKGWPYSGWCNGASWAYAPGTGLYWQDAWNELGTCSSASRKAAAVKNEMLFSPNPTSGLTTINLSMSSKVSVFNNQGTAVLNDIEMEANGVIDLGMLPSGIYNLKIDTQSGVIYYKISKQ